jgi:hypothetical protein
MEIACDRRREVRTGTIISRAVASNVADKEILDADETT